MRMRSPIPAGDWFEEVKRRGVLKVAEAFGLELGPNRSIPCPACGEDRRGRSDRRFPAGLRHDEQGWRCHRCDASGDAVTLAAWLVTGSANPGDRWVEVRRACAERGLCTRDPRDGGPPVRLRPLPPPRPPAPPKRPPAEEVAALWRRCLPLAVPEDLEVAEYLIARRGWTAKEAAAVNDLDLARSLPADGELPNWWPWRRPWRLIAPAFDAAGRMASLHARRIDDGGTPKTRWPLGYEAGGLLFADGLGVRLLRGDLPREVEGVVLCEGLTDTLRTAARAHLHGWPWAVLGMTEGGARALRELGSRWPKGLPLYVATDEDSQGEKYAAEVRRTMPRGVPLRRVMLSKVERTDLE